MLQTKGEENRELEKVTTNAIKMDDNKERKSAKKRQEIKQQKRKQKRVQRSKGRTKKYKNRDRKIAA